MTIQILASYVFAFFLVFAGAYLLLLSTVLHEHRRPAGVKMLAAVGRMRESKDIWLKPPFSIILELVSRAVYMNPGDRQMLKNKLLRLALPYEPEQYVARGYCGLGAGVILALIFAVLQAYILIPVGAVFGILLYLKNKDMVNDRIDEMNAKARRELPQFVRSIRASLQGDRDLIRIISRYMKICGPGLRRDLEILLTDMNTGNIQEAFRHFGGRIALPEVSHLVTILINIERGIDQDAALTYLASNLSASAREANKRELMLRPSKLKKAMIPAIIIAIAAMFYVFVASVLNSMNTVF